MKTLDFRGNCGLVRSRAIVQKSVLVRRYWNASSIVIVHLVEG